MSITEGTTTPGQLTLDELAAEEPLASATFVIVDLETTGGPATEAGITEIGAVKVRGGQTLATRKPRPASPALPRAA